jgi:transposase InsO family protein
MAGGRFCGWGHRATAAWIANQLTEACGSIGIRDRPTSPRSPWQNAYAERPIGSIRRECIDHIVVFGERHLRHVLLSYMSYYNSTRTHLSLNKDAPMSRGAEPAGRLLCHPILGGLIINMFGFDMR